RPVGHALRAVVRVHHKDVFAAHAGQGEREEHRGRGLAGPPFQDVDHPPWDGLSAHDPPSPGVNNGSGHLTCANMRPAEPPADGRTLVDLRARYWTPPGTSHTVTENVSSGAVDVWVACCVTRRTTRPGEVTTHTTSPSRRESVIDSPDARAASR